MAGLYTGDPKSGQVWVRTHSKQWLSVYKDLRSTMSGGLTLGGNRRGIFARSSRIADFLAVQNPSTSPTPSRTHIPCGT